MEKQNFVADSWHTDKPHVKCCRLPYAINSKEAEVYKLLLHSHCKHPDKKSGDHHCTGAVTISQNSLVAKCKQCGDCKGNFKTLPTAKS